MATPKILISDPVDLCCADILRKNGFQVDQIKLTKEELLVKIKEYDGLIVRSETKVTADVLKAATKLRVVGRAGTGVDNVDLETATEKGILVMNTPGGNTLSAAEHTCALIASMARNIPAGCASMKTGAWDRKLFSGNELYGKTLAILGLGRIGKEVAIRMQSYGMKTIGYDPIIPAEVSREFGVESMTLEQIWPLADFITVHTPLIPQTRNLINDEVFKKCKKGVRLVNVARGGIIDEESLFRNLQSGQCGGAGLDVFVEEPPKSAYYKDLFAHPKMVCTPHLGASTSEAQLRVAEEIGDGFVQFFNGTALLGAVNAGSLASAMSGVNKPWLTVGRGLGLVASILGNNATSIDITVQDSTLTDTSFLPSAVVSGYLSGVSHDPTINMINAPALAKAKGITVTVTKSKGTPAVEKTLIVSAKIGSATFKITGTLHGNVAVLNSIDDNEFPGGLLMEGTVIFYTGNTSDNSGFTTLDGALRTKGIRATSLHQSTAKTGDTTWLAAHVKAIPQDVSLAATTGLKFIALRHF
jgi:D-3-phosphoglycerate dehydrogenase